MMKKLAAALLAAAMTVSVSAPAFAFDEGDANDLNTQFDDVGLNMEAELVEDDIYVSGELNLSDFVGTIPVANWGFLTDDGLGHGNYVAADVVKPGKTYYISSALLLNLADPDGETAPTEGEISQILKVAGKVLSDKKLVKLSVDKEEGSKLVDSMKLVEKTFGRNAGHLPAIEIKMNDFLTDDEQKVEMNLEFKLKDDLSAKDVIRDLGLPQDGDPNDIYLADGFTIAADIEFWVNNEVTTTDGEDAMAGDGGAIWKPTKNEEQEYTWEDENNTLATLTYDSDDGQTKMYYKLSTKWDNAYYAEHFADQDAFLYDFIAGPSASSTSRATLQLRVPFVDEDDELTCAEDEIYVYEMDEEGNLTDISNKFTFTEDDSNGYVLETKLRELGTYVVAGPLGAADADEAASAGVHTGIFLDAYM